MKYIFPKNYNFKNKILGVLDYPTAIFNVFAFVIVFSVMNTLFKNISTRVVFIIIFYFPILLISLIGFSNESVLYTFFYILKYFLSPKLYLYK